jgi:4-hydroxy-3-methylbut-2-enyl diphosphate reductase
VRLVEVSQQLGTPAYRIDVAAEIDPAWLDGVQTVGVTSGASVPEYLVTETVDRLADLGFTAVEQVETVAESTKFATPRELRTAA